MFIKPDYDVDSIYEIDYQALKAQGVKGLIFDLDSTVMESKSGDFTPRTLELFKKLQNDFLIAIVTNNHDKKYLDKVKSVSPFPVYGNAQKPDPTVLKKAISDLCLKPSYIAMIGDRPLTDIWGGKEAKVKVTILVDSISADTEGMLTRFVRKLERLTIKK